jgi:hypothetical protein
MIENRPLNIDDCDQLIQLMKSRSSTFNGYTDQELQHQFAHDIDITVPYYFTNPLYYIPGVFVDGKLSVAVICKEFSNSPCWAWGYWLSDGRNNLMHTKEGVMALKQWDQTLFDEMEVSRKLNRFFLVYENRYNNTVKSTGFDERLFTWMGRQGYRVSNYQFITDCELEPNTEPKYEYQKQLLSNRTWPIPLRIRMGVLSK